MSTRITEASFKHVPREKRQPLITATKAARYTKLRIFGLSAIVIIAIDALPPARDVLCIIIAPMRLHTVVSGNWNGEWRTGVYKSQACECELNALYRGQNCRGQSAYARNAKVTQHCKRVSSSFVTFHILIEPFLTYTRAGTCVAL